VVVVVEICYIHPRMHKLGQALCASRGAEVERWLEQCARSKGLVQCLTRARAG
jgi:hypothetical protein